MSVVKPQSCPSTVVNPLLSRNTRPLAAFGNPLPSFWFEESDNNEGENKSKKTVAEIVKEAADELLKAANGNKDSALETLIKRNYKLEQRAEKAEETLNNFKEKLPDESEQKKQVAELAEWRELAESPKAAKELIENGNSAIEKAQSLEREKLVNEAASTAGFKPDVLNDLAQSKGFTLEVREIKEGDKTEKRAFAKYKDGGKDAEKPLADYAADALASYLPALKAEGAAPQLARMVEQGSGRQEKSFNEDQARKGQAPLYRDL